jgi:hypothetical protein
MLWPQLVGVDAGHDPALQNAAGVTWFVAASHEGAWHWTEPSGTAHASVSVPLHVPLHVGSVPGQGAREPTGVPLTGEQVPREAARLQASHWPLQPLLQQTPSAQNVDAHWPPEVQGSPSWPLLLQWFVESQKLPCAQSVAVVHVVPHAVPLQT